MEGSRSITAWLGIVLLTGAGLLRWHSLGEPQFWYDEAITALRVGGHTEQEVLDSASSGGVAPLGDYQRFLQGAPDRGVRDVVRSLTAEDPQHTPLYYVVAHYWVRLFGSEPGRARGLAVLFSLFLLPATYWLARELFTYRGTFASPWPVWLAVTAVTLSPYNVAFGREHREYSLWMLTLALLSAAFLRALRLRRSRDWVIFSALLALAAYTQMLTWLVAVALAVYVGLRHAREWRTVGRDFALATVSAGLLFLPWASVLLTHRSAAQENLSWVDQQATRPRFSISHSLAPHFITGEFALAGVNSRRSDETRSRNLAIQLASTYFPYLLLGGLALLYPRSKNGALLFIGLLYASTTLPFLAADLWSGGILGYVFRYAAPAALAWMLALAFVLGCLAEQAGPYRIPARAVVVAALALMGWGAYLENQEIYPAQKSPSDYGSVASYLNLHPGVTLLSDEYVGSLLSLASQTRQDLPVLLRPRCLSCPQPGRPILDVPPFDFSTQPLYYRSWYNLSSAATDHLVTRLTADQAGDPRYRSKPVATPEAAIFLFTLQAR